MSRASSMPCLLGNMSPQCAGFQKAQKRSRRHAPALDGGRSPFAQPLVLPTIAARSKSGGEFGVSSEHSSAGTPATGHLTPMTTSAAGLTPTPPSLERGRGSGLSAWSATPARQAQSEAGLSTPTPYHGLPSAPLSAPHEKRPSSKASHGQPHRRRGKSVSAAVARPVEKASKGCDSSTSPHGQSQALLGPPPAPRALRRVKTWAEEAAEVEESTPSAISPYAQPPGASLMVVRSASNSLPSTPGTSNAVPGADGSPTPVVGKKWIRGAKIGSGSYGCVYKALDKETGLIFVVKRAIIEEQNAEDQKYRDKLEGELEICKDLRHPNIVSYLGHENAGGYLYIHLEYVSGGSMSSILSQFGPLEGGLLRTAMRGLLEGLNYLHTRHPNPVVHRDIKAANILVDINFAVKLADFGCSKRDAVTKSFRTIGSIPWMAPEVIHQQDGHGRKADIWSVGCTFIEMATAEKPWGKDTFDNIFFAMRHIGLSNSIPPIPESLSEVGRDLASRCLRRVPEERPSALDLLEEHEFVATTSFNGPSR